MQLPLSSPMPPAALALTSWRMPPCPVTHLGYPRPRSCGGGRTASPLTSSTASPCLDLAPSLSTVRLRLGGCWMNSESVYYIIIHLVLLASLSPGVRLSSSFSSSFLFILFSQCILYQQSPTPIFCCCSPFSFHTFQISLNAVLPLHSGSSSPPFTLHFLDIWSLG